MKKQARESTSRKWRAIVAYTGRGIDWEFDAMLEARARRRKGEEIGSGYAFGKPGFRDLEFSFRKETQAAGFISAAKKAAKVCGVRLSESRFEEECS